MIVFISLATAAIFAHTFYEILFQSIAITFDSPNHRFIPQQINAKDNTVFLPITILELCKAKSLSRFVFLCYLEFAKFRVI